MHRKPEGELRVLVFQAGCLDRAAVHFDDALDDIQSETRAFDVEAAGFVHLVELLEHAVDLLGRDALAAVADGDVDLLHIVK